MFFYEEIAPRYRPIRKTNRADIGRFEKKSALFQVELKKNQPYFRSSSKTDRAEIGRFENLIGLIRSILDFRVFWTRFHPEFFSGKKWGAIQAD